MPWKRCEPVGLGYEARGSGPGVSADALFLGGALVHLSAASGGEQLLLAGPDRRVLDAGGRLVGHSRQAMKTVRLRPRLGILFVLAVGLPSAALVLMAIRSITGEEAILEKRLERTLGAELDHVVTLAGRRDERCPRGVLGRSLPRTPVPADRAALPAWKASSDLVGVPFLLTADDRSVEPAAPRA